MKNKKAKSKVQAILIEKNMKIVDLFNKIKEENIMNAASSLPNMYVYGRSMYRGAPRRPETPVDQRKMNLLRLKLNIQELCDRFSLGVDDEIIVLDFLTKKTKEIGFDIDQLFVEVYAWVCDNCDKQGVPIVKYDELRLC